MSKISQILAPSGPENLLELERILWLLKVDSNLANYTFEMTWLFATRKQLVGYVVLLVCEGVLAFRDGVFIRYIEEIQGSR